MVITEMHNNKYHCFVTKSCLTLLGPHGLQPTTLLCPQDFPGKNTGVDCHFFLQGIVSSQGLHPHLLYCRQIIYHWAIRASCNNNWGFINGS